MSIIISTFQRQHILKYLNRKHHYYKFHLYTSTDHRDSRNMLNGNCRVTSSSYMFFHSSLVGIHIFHFCYYNLWNLIFCSHMIYHILIHMSMVHNLEIEVNKHSCLKTRGSQAMMVT